MSQDLERTTFVISRQMEYFTIPELTKQIGQPLHLWPIACLKEAIDNSLDACERAKRNPRVGVTIADDSFSIRDNGLGIPERTVRNSLDYLKRVSDNVCRVAPTRGLMGNGLKTFWAAPFVTGKNVGSKIEIASHGTLSRLTVRVNHRAQRPEIDCRQEASEAKIGTFLKIWWPWQPCSPERHGSLTFYLEARRLLQKYILFNPHACFSLRTPAGAVAGRRAANPTWDKWTPNDKPSAWWYTASDLLNQVRGELHANDKQTVRWLIGQFDGLSGTAKQRQVFEQARLPGDLLEDLERNDTEGVDAEAVGRLLAAMRGRSRRVKSAALGVIGEEHIIGAMARYYEVKLGAIYKKFVSKSQTLPFVLEVAIGIKMSAKSQRTVAVGMNWSPAIGDPIAKLDGLLGENRIYSSDPVAVVVHLACPRLEFADRGKGRLILTGEMSDALARCVKAAAKDWKQKKWEAGKAERVSQRGLDVRKGKRGAVQDAAFQIMEQSYREASAGQGMAECRQMWYKADPLIKKITGGKSCKNSKDFTQGYLIKFMQDPKNAAIVADWDVVFDSRGHLIEPHTGRTIPMGTLPIREHVKEWTVGIPERVERLPVPFMMPTVGPNNRYRFVLFLEKEGFNFLLRKAKIQERYDIALESTKGMSVTACRQLAEKYAEVGVTVLVLRDFDKYGHIIWHTLAEDTPRLKYTTKPLAINLGLKLSDIKEMKLEGELALYRTAKDPRVKLRECGATEEECNYLVRRRVGPKLWEGYKVELNAMDSRQFLDFVERQLKKVGAGKFIPDAPTLNEAFQRQRHVLAISNAAEVARQNPPPFVQPPADLDALVRAKLAARPEIPWEAAVYEIVRESGI